MHGGHGYDPTGGGATAAGGLVRIISDLALYRRLARQAVPMWPLVAALFLVGLLASPLALLAPLPLKIAVDTVLGSRPLPTLLASLLPASMRSPSGVLVLVAVLAILIAVATQLQVAAQKYLTVLGGERLQLDRKSTRLNSSHSQISYAVFCLKKKK